jgi:hypothetical protein
MRLNLSQISNKFNQLVVIHGSKVLTPEIQNQSLLSTKTCLFAVYESESGLPEQIEADRGIVIESTEQLWMLIGAF